MKKHLLYATLGTGLVLSCFVVFGKGNEGSPFEEHSSAPILSETTSMEATSMEATSMEATSMEATSSEISQSTQIKEAEPVRYAVPELWAEVTTATGIYQYNNSSSTLLLAVVPGNKCQIYGYTADGYYQVMRHGTWGYIPMTNVTMAEDVDLTATFPLVCLDTKGFVATGATSYQGPDPQYQEVETLSSPCFVWITGEIGDWYQSAKGYLPKSSVETQLSAYRQKEAEAMIAMAEVKTSGVELGQQIVDYAHHFLEYPYRDSGSDLNGFDCAGFASYIYRCFGIKVGTTPRDVWSGGTAVEREDLQPGDLIIFGTLSHVGIYIGNHQIIHSATSSTAEKVLISSLDETYYKNNYNTARRYIEY